jgi:uncharacterized membrane protein
MHARRTEVDDNVFRAGWFGPENGTDGPCRGERCKYEGTDFKAFMDEVLKRPFEGPQCIQQLIGEYRHRKQIGLVASLSVIAFGLAVTVFIAAVLSFQRPLDWEVGFWIYLSGVVALLVGVVLALRVWSLVGDGKRIIAVLFDGAPPPRQKTETKNICTDGCAYGTCTSENGS